MFDGIVSEYPTYYLIGGMRCGTTSINKYLSQHPDISVAERKESHYMSFLAQNEPFWAIKDKTEYLNLFDSKKPVKIDSSAWYLYYDKTPKKIKELNKDAKIIVSVRNPLDRLISHYNFCKYNLELEDLSFKEAVGKSIRNEKREQFKDIGGDYYDMGLYFSHILPWLNEFGRNCIHFVDFDNLSKNPIDEMDKLFKFLNVPPIKLDIKVHNSSLKKDNEYPKELICKLKYLYNKDFNLFKKLITI